MEIAGIDAADIVSQLMQIEQRPLVALETRKTDAQAASEAIGRIRTKIDAFRLAADRLSLSTAFDRFAANVSDPDAVGVTVSGATAATSLSFTVDQLAQAHGLRSVGTVASGAVTITDQSSFVIPSGTGQLGIASVRAGAGLTAGEYAIDVVQASAGAVKTGSTPLAASTVIDASNESFDITVNGTARTVTLAQGTYDATGLVAAVQAGLDASGGGVTAELAGGVLQLTTQLEGSSASIEVPNPKGPGRGLIALGLERDTAAHVGTDAVIEVGGTTTTLTSVQAGTTATIDTGAGSLDITLAGGVRIGSADVEVVSTGDRSLDDVVAAINAARAGVTAAAVQVDAGAWRLQLTSTTTGEDSTIGIDTTIFTGLGGMIESSAARDAQITIGSGPGAYTVESASNTFANILPGVSITAKAVTTAAVSVSLERDTAPIADDVAKMVESANELLADIKVQTRSDPTAGTSGPLAGDATIRLLADRIRDAVAGQVSGLETSLPWSVGIERDRSGTITFDRERFLAAIEEDPDAVARLFARGGTATGDAVFASARPETVAGSYAVEVTTAATRATSALLFDGGAATDTRLGVRIGSTTATLDVRAGQSTTEIVAELNAALVAAGIDVTAQTDGTGLRLVAGAWGSAGGFEINTDVLGAGTWAAQSGTDVAGTIDGVAATGIGRRLSLPSDASTPAAGLAIDVAAGAVGALGNVDYVPGIAARVVAVTTSLTQADTGVIANAKSAAERRVDDFNDQITRLEERLLVRETNLRRQWANLQTLLSGLQSQGSWLSGQLAGLNNNWGSI